MHDPNTICPWHTDDRGIKKKKKGGWGDGGGAAEVSNFLYIESKSKTTKHLSGGGGRCD